MDEAIDDPDDVPARMRAKRAANRWTQAQAAASLGVSEHTYRRFEAGLGLRGITIARAADLALWLKVAVDDLVTTILAAPEPETT